MNGEVRAAVLLVQGTASVAVECNVVRAAAVGAAFAQEDVLGVLCVRVEPGGLSPGVGVNPALLNGGFCINAKGGVSVVV